MAEKEERLTEFVAFYTREGDVHYDNLSDKENSAYISIEPEYQRYNSASRYQGRSDSLVQDIFL